MPFLLWLTIIASVMATAGLWFFVRRISRDGFDSLFPAPEPQPRDYEKERRENIARQEKERAMQAAAQKRRDDARAHSELLFTLYAPEIGRRFSRKMFQLFLQKYMGDERAPDEVEQRARQLEVILQEHRAAVRPAPRFKSIEELAAWYIAEKKRIEALPIDELFREQQTVQLTTLYAELTQQVLEQA